MVSQREVQAQVRWEDVADLFNDNCPYIMGDEDYWTENILR